MTKTVICFSLPGDTHLKDVSKFISKDIKIELIDGFDFCRNTWCHIDYRNHKNTYLLLKTGAKIYLQDVLSIWWRKPNPVNVKALQHDMQAFYLRETNDTFSGFLHEAERLGKPVINHPINNFAASVKPAQLSYALECGFLIPDTSISCVPDEALNFIERHKNDNGNVISKGVSLSWAINDEDHYSIFIKKITDRQVKEIDQIKECPATLQRLIHRKYDYRIVFVDGEIFAFRIKFSGKVEDWRLVTTSKDTEYEYITFEEGEFTKRMIRFMKYFNLRFGVFDFVLGSDNKLYFLELNPNGQWVWLDHETNQSRIARAIGKLLSGE